MDHRKTKPVLNLYNPPRRFLPLNRHGSQLWLTKGSGKNRWPRMEAAQECGYKCTCTSLLLYPDKLYGARLYSLVTDRQTLFRCQYLLQKDVSSQTWLLDSPEHCGYMEIFFEKCLPAKEEEDFVHICRNLLLLQTDVLNIRSKMSAYDCCIKRYICKYIKERGCTAHVCRATPLLMALEAFFKQEQEQEEQEREEQEQEQKEQEKEQKELKEQE
ncbi:hypothetical protein HELRODRAFT_162140 [Helobdella robusta]|uniref:Uncharacterized protein n=1 Tax=Helobdella robusta TaxID=6412 RepID=T1ESA0_HELRO|nr:hypothetical protein HELRODRAFT_162140 [Helobdella robusta]ESN98686.1 hypothetical protein HELRODRAFT_162140 [Helobdella robusta]